MPPPPDLKTLLLQIQLPGMSRPESDLAKEWLDRNGPQFDELSFNVRVGQGAAENPADDESTRRLKRAVSRFRIDTLARVERRVTIVEFKIRAGLNVMGQILGYRVLYGAEHPDFAVEKLIVVARKADIDVMAVLSVHGVQLDLFPFRPRAT